MPYFYCVKKWEGIKCIVVALLWAALLPAHGQKGDTVLMNAWYDSMSSYMDHSPEKALHFVHAGLHHAQKHGNTLWQGYFLQAGGIVHDIANHMDSGMAYYEKTLALARAEKDTVLEANALGNMGAAYHARGYLQPALTYHLQAARLRENMPNPYYLAKSYNNIGLLYRLLKDYPHAIDYFTRSISIKETVADTLGLSTTLLNMSSCFLYKKEYDSALHYARRALELAEYTGNPAKLAVAKGNIGLAWLGKKRTETALPYLTSAVALAEKGGFDEEYFSIYNGLGEYYASLPDLKQSHYWLSKGLQIATALQRRENIVAFQRKLANLEYKMGNAAAAYKLQEAADRTNDSLLNEASLRQLSELNIVYETELKEARIQQLTHEALLSQLNLMQKNKERNALLVGLLLVVALAGIIGWALHNNKQKNKLLEEKRKIIEHQLEEKEVLMREIHHRVKNNLQIISGLLHLQSRHIDDPNALKAVREGRNRVKSIALIHQQLYQQENLTEIKLKEYLQELMHSIHQSFKDDNKKIVQKLTCPEIHMDVEIAVPLGLIINECVTNAYKHAFTQSASGIMEVSIATDHSSMQLIIQDNGKGLPEGFEWKHQKSFGIKMIGNLVNKLKANFSIYNRVGTRIEIYIPNYTNIT